MSHYFVQYFGQDRPFLNDRTSPAPHGSSAPDSFNPHTSPPQTRLPAPPIHFPHTQKARKQSPASGPFPESFLFLVSSGLF